MEDQILSEIKTIKQLLAKLTGTADQPKGKAFSVAALDKAAKAFQKLSIQRGEWIHSEDIHKVIKSAPYGAGKFIREELVFKNCFKRGHSYYFNKKDLKQLAQALKERQVNLQRYMEYKADQEKFVRHLSKLQEKQQGGIPPYLLPEDARNVDSSPVKSPDPALIHEDLAQLRQAFVQQELSEYIDVYHDNYAMLKEMYYYKRYLDPLILKRCRKWINDFNYAQHALGLLNQKPEPFIPVAEEDQIEL